MNKSKKQNNSVFYILTILGALVLALVINKDIPIPSWLVIVSGIIGVVFLLIRGVNKPELPFYVLVAYLPFNKVLSGTFGGFMTAVNLTNILIFLSLFSWLIYAMFTKRRLFEHNALNWIIFLFCLLGIFSVVRGGFYYGSRYFMEFIFPLKRWLTPVFLYFLAINIVRDREILKKTIIIIMIVVAVAGLLTVKEGLDIGDAGSLDSSRVGGLAQQPNMMGAFFVYYMFLYLGFFFLYLKRFSYWTLLLPFLLCFRAVQLTYSRGAYMALALGLLAVTFFKNKFILILLSLGLLVAVLNPQWLPGGMRFAIDRTSKGGEFYDSASLEDKVDPSAAKRIEIWKGAVEIIKDNPVWGVGYGAFPYVIPYYISNMGEVDAHNTYLIIAAEMGIPVLIIFLLIIFALFKNAWWLYRRVEDRFIKAVGLGMIGGIAGMLVANMFGSRLESEEVSAYFWVLAGLIVRAVLMKKRKEIV